jgi:hypothetical protein
MKGSVLTNTTGSIEGGIQLSSRKVEKLALDPRLIRSKWHQDLLKDWQPDREYIEFLKSNYRQGNYIAPVVIVRENGEYYIVDGHHRVWAALEMEQKEISCILIEGTFKDTEPLRNAELLLKKFDRDTGFSYGFSGHLRRWSADMENHRIGILYRESLKSRIGKFLKARIDDLKNKLSGKRKWEL